MSETFSGSHGRLVVAIDTAEEIGNVKGFVVDPTAKRIDAVHVSGRGKNAEIIAWASIRSFGNDAVIAKTADAAVQVSGDHDTQAVKGNIEMQGSRVLTTTGLAHGTVEDVTFDAESGELLGASTTDGGYVEASRFRALGSYALIVDLE